MKYTLAFDIERSGCTKNYDTIGIGASVVDSNFNELDSLFLAGYFPKETQFEKRCWDEFWVKNQDSLKQLEYSGTLNYKERQAEIIFLFQEFRKKWENKALADNVELDLVSDGCVFDAGFINEMIFEHLDNVLPIPYSASTQQFSPFYDTTSEIKGILSIVDPTFKENWGYFNKLNELYNLPKFEKKHDHNPANDAFTIAVQHQIVLNIRDKKITLK
jgi:hypothetical protein